MIKREKKKDEKRSNLIQNMQRSNLLNFLYKEDKE